MDRPRKQRWPAEILPRLFAALINNYRFVPRKVFASYQIRFVSFQQTIDSKCQQTPEIEYQKHAKRLLQYYCLLFQVDSGGPALKVEPATGGAAGISEKFWQ